MHKTLLFGGQTAAAPCSRFFIAYTLFRVKVRKEMKVRMVLLEEYRLKDRWKGE